MQSALFLNHQDDQSKAERNYPTSPLSGLSFKEIVDFLVLLAFLVVIFPGDIPLHLYFLILCERATSPPEIQLHNQRPVIRDGIVPPRYRPRIHAAPQACVLDVPRDQDVVECDVAHEVEAPGRQAILLLADSAEKFRPVRAKYGGAYGGTIFRDSPF